MTLLTEGQHRAEFLISEANGGRSRETGTLAAGQDLEAGTVLGQPAGDELVAWTGEEFTDGAEDDPVGILYDNVDTTDGVAKTGVTYIARDAEVNQAELIFPAGLAAFGVTKLEQVLKIICR